MIRYNRSWILSILVVFVVIAGASFGACGSAAVSSLPSQISLDVLTIS